MAFGSKANNIPNSPEHVSEAPAAGKARRALTTMLQDAGDQIIAVKQGEGATAEEILRSKSQILSDLVWEMLLYRTVHFPDGTTLKINSIAEWFEAVKFLYRQVDGAPPAEVGLTLNPNFDPKAWAEERRQRLESTVAELPDESVLAVPTPQSQETSSTDDLEAALENAEPVTGTVFDMNRDVA